MARENETVTLATYVSAFLFPFPAPPGAPIQLVLASCVSLALALAAVALAMPNRYDAMPWAATHHEHALRTPMIGFAVWTIGGALGFVNGALVIVGFYVRVAVVIWATIRAGVGLVLALMRRPVWNPKGWLQGPHPPQLLQLLFKQSAPSACQEEEKERRT